MSAYQGKHSWETAAALTITEGIKIEMQARVRLKRSACQTSEGVRAVVRDADAARFPAHGALLRRHTRP